MVATFYWEGDVPQTGTVLWQINLRSGDRQTVRFLGYKVVDGQHSAQFVFDFEGAWQATPQPSAHLEAHRLTARFSPLAMEGMGHGWTWEAVLSVDGADVGTHRP